MTTKNQDEVDQFKDELTADLQDINVNKERINSILRGYKNKEQKFKDIEKFVSNHTASRNMSDVNFHRRRVV